MKPDGKRKFLIVTGNCYPHGDAGAVRLHSFANILCSLDYKPVVIGMGETTDFKEKTMGKIHYYSLRYPSKTYIVRAMGRLFYKKHLAKIMDSFSTEDISGILIDSGNNSTLAYVKSFALKHNIPLVYDSVEWYSPSEFKNGKRNKTYRHNNLLNTKLIDSCYKVIAISKYLESNFELKGIKTVRIPVIMDVQERQIREISKTIQEPIKIIYAGSIGSKDHIKELVEAIGKLNEEERARILFCVMGITKEQYEKQFGRIKDGIVDSSVKFMGRVPRDTVLEQLNSADFSFLLRPAQERYAKAGFPTKVVEGLSAGVPILCNYSSDLDLYLRDGENSIIIEDCSTDACVKALKKVLSCSKEELDNMKINARKTAEDNFDWRLYVDLFREFIQ